MPGSKPRRSPAGTGVRLIRRTAGYGPVCPVVWEGCSREAAPYPDLASAITNPRGGFARHPLWRSRPANLRNQIDSSSRHGRRVISVDVLCSAFSADIPNFTTHTFTAVSWPSRPIQKAIPFQKSSPSIFINEIRWLSSHRLPSFPARFTSRFQIFLISQENQAFHHG